MTVIHIAVFRIHLGLRKTKTIFCFIIKKILFQRVRLGTASETIKLTKKITVY
jgi:hypothetical protein